MDGAIEQGDYNNMAVWTIYDPADTNVRKLVTAFFTFRSGADTYNGSGSLVGQWMGSPAAVTSVSFVPASTYAGGTYEIYGVK